MSVKWFGALGITDLGDIPDDYIPIQAAYNYVGITSVANQATPTPLSAANFPTIKVVFPLSKGYATSASISITDRYSSTEGTSWTLLLAHGTFSGFLMNFTGINFEVNFKGMNFASTSTGCIEFNSTDNSDARVNFEDCKFSRNSVVDTGIGLQYRNKSSSLTFKRCYFQAIKTPVHVLECDFSSFEDCWFGFAAAATYTTGDGYIRNDQGFMRINNSIFSGGPSLGGSEIAYVNCGTAGSSTGANISISKCRIGFESGAGALVNYYVVNPGDTGSAFRSGITLNNIQTAPREDQANAPDGITTAPMLRFFAMPQRLSIKDVRIHVGRIALIVAGSTTTLSALRTSVRSPLNYYTDLADQTLFNTANSYDVASINCPETYAALTTDLVECQRWTELLGVFNYYFPSSSPLAAGGPVTITVDTFFSDMVGGESGLFKVSGGGRMVASGTPTYGPIAGTAAVLYSAPGDSWSGSFVSDIDYSGLAEGVTATVVFLVGGVEFVNITAAQAATATLRIKLQATSNPGVAPIRCRGLIVKPYLADLPSVNSRGLAQID